MSFCRLPEAEGQVRVSFFNAAELLGKENNINLEPPAILTSVAPYQKFIQTDWKHPANSNCKQCWLLQSPGHSGEYAFLRKSPSDTQCVAYKLSFCIHFFSYICSPQTAARCNIFNGVFLDLLNTNIPQLNVM